MKILLADNHITGHHAPYLSALVNGLKQNFDVVLLVPEDSFHLGVRTYFCDEYVHSIRGSISWLKRVCSVAQKEKVDIVHLLTGDDFYRFFGIGFWRLKGYKTVVTFHNAKQGALFQCSYRSIFRQIDRGICHTEFIENVLHGYGIHNCTHIEYPQLNDQDFPSREAARKALQIDGKAPVLAALGEARFSKGLDLLLKALQSVQHPFQLLIAGREGAFSNQYVEELTRSYSSQVTMLRRFLTEQELQNCIAAADYVVLPYRLDFYGASGPLAEAVWAGRPVISAGHGSLGDIVKKHHLGYTFASEDVQDLAKVIDQALASKFLFDDAAEAYRRRIDAGTFCSRYQEVYRSLI